MCFSWLNWDLIQMFLHELTAAYFCTAPNNKLIHKLIQLNYSVRSIVSIFVTPPIHGVYVCMHLEKKKTNSVELLKVTRRTRRDSATYCDFPKLHYKYTALKSIKWKEKKNVVNDRIGLIIQKRKFRGKKWVQKVTKSKTRSRWTTRGRCVMTREHDSLRYNRIPTST